MLTTDCTISLSTGSLVALILMDKLGRKILLLWSFSGMVNNLIYVLGSLFVLYKLLIMFHMKKYVRKNIIFRVIQVGHTPSVSKLEKHVSSVCLLSVC